MTIVGEIDGSTAPQAQEQILPLVGAGCQDHAGHEPGVTYMSSAGLRMLLLAYRTINGKGGKIVLVGLSDELKDTMSVTVFWSSSPCCRHARRRAQPSWREARGAATHGTQ